MQILSMHSLVWSRGGQSAPPLHASTVTARERVEWPWLHRNVHKRTCHVPCVKRTCVPNKLESIRNAVVPACCIASGPLPALLDLAVDDDPSIALLLVAGRVVGLATGEVGLVRTVCGHEGGGQQGRFHQSGTGTRKRKEVSCERWTRCTRRWPHERGKSEATLLSDRFDFKVFSLTP